MRIHANVALLKTTGGALLILSERLLKGNAEDRILEFVANVLAYRNLPRGEFARTVDSPNWNPPLPKREVTDAHAGTSALVGFGQFSRSDSLLMFFVIGTMKDRDQCKSSIDALFTDFADGSSKAGHTAKADFAACDKTVPSGTEYDALRNRAPTQHYILFHPNLRVMIVHPRGSLDYERATCEMIRGQLFSRLGIEAKCDAPDPSWIKNIL